MHRSLILTLRHWHRWVGLIALIFLLIAGASGAALSYKHALIRWLITDSAQLPANFTPADMPAQLDRIVAQTAATQRARIKAPNSEEPYWTLTGADGQTQLLAIDSLAPYTDNLWLLSTIAFTHELHIELLSGVAGEAVLLICGIACLALIISGVLVWWPARKNFRWQRVVPRPMSPRALLLSHRDAGALLTPVLFVVTLTGSIMLWQKLVAPLLPPAPTQPLLTNIDSTSASSVWLQRAIDAVPDGWPTYIRLPSHEKPEANIRFRLPGEWHINGRTSVTFDIEKGTATISQRSDQAEPSRRLLNQLYPLHTGYGMGWLYAALTFIGGIIMTWLSISGGLGYLHRRSKRMHQRQTRMTEQA